MSSSDRTRHLSLCPTAPPPRVVTSPEEGRTEPATRRMRPDEVHALLHELADAPAPSAGQAPRVHPRDAADFADASELPTLLYRPQKRLTHAMLRIDATESATRTLHGLGPAGSPRIVFASGVSDAPADDDDGWDDWVNTSELRMGAIDAGNTEQAPTYPFSVSPSAPSLPPSDPTTGARARCEVERASLARRSRRLAWLMCVLLAASPGIVALVHWASTPASAVMGAHEAAAPAFVVADVTGTEAGSDPDDVTLIGPRETTSELALPRALRAAALALDAAGNADAATRAGRARLASATEQLLAGETVEALASFRALAQRAPDVPMLGHVVRLLEQQLQACAARGGEACR